MQELPGKMAEYLWPHGSSERTDVASLAMCQPEAAFFRCVGARTNVYDVLLIKLPLLSIILQTLKSLFGLTAGFVTRYDPS